MLTNLHRTNSFNKHKTAKILSQKVSYKTKSASKSYFRMSNKKIRFKLKSDYLIKLSESLNYCVYKV